MCLCSQWRERVQPNLRAGQPAGKDPPEVPYLWSQGCSPGGKLLLAFPVAALKRKHVANIPICQYKAHCFVLESAVISIWLWNGLAGVECFRCALKVTPLDVANYSYCICVWLLDSLFGVVPSLKGQQTLENCQQNTHGIACACVLSCTFLHWRDGELEQQALTLVERSLAPSMCLPAAVAYPSGGLIGTLGAMAVFLVSGSFPQETGISLVASGEAVVLACHVCGTIGAYGENDFGHWLCFVCGVRNSLAARHIFIYRGKMDSVEWRDNASNRGAWEKKVAICALTFARRNLLVSSFLPWRDELSDDPGGVEVQSFCL